jgi:hypothetical protein
VLRTDFKFNGYDAPYELAIARGYYKAVGLDVSVEQGQGSATTVQTVASGVDTFGLADSGTTVLGISAQNIPVKILAVYSQTNTMGFIYHADDNFDGKLPSMKGRIVISSAGSADAKLMDPTLATAGMTTADVKMHGRTRPTHLFERNLWLGLKADFLRHACLTSTGAVLRPIFRQIQLIGYWQARLMIGDRQRHRHLAIVLLAELAAVLPRHANRVAPLLGQARVVDDPRLDRPMPFHRRQYQFAHFGQNCRVRPRRFADEMQQRLMLRSNACRRRHRRHRFHTLALARHH